MPPLTQELRVWRAEVADVAGIPVFMILTNRQLRDIVRLRPASLAALGGISGIGQARLQKYGRVLLERVRGGSWNNNAQNCRSANRNNNTPSNMNNNIGLRLSSTAQCEWPRFTDRGRVRGLSRSPSGSGSGHAAGSGQRQTGGPRLVIVARGVAVSVGAVFLHDLNLR
jgi:hypothetical protein